ncbi:MAG TPA: hypothetical protein VN282_17135 [Pyrinomonadaceae bacterium]|nr:hypothetical protein [Pyrinomonadaceae bacterium]
MATKKASAKKPGASTSEEPGTMKDATPFMKGGGSGSTKKPPPIGTKTGSKKSAKKSAKKSNK